MTCGVLCLAHAAVALAAAAVPFGSTWRCIVSEPQTADTQWTLPGYPDDEWALVPGPVRLVGGLACIRDPFADVPCVAPNQGDARVRDSTEYTLCAMPCNGLLGLLGWC